MFCWIVRQTTPTFRVRSWTRGRAAKKYHTFFARNFGFEADRNRVPAIDWRRMFLCGR